jgi:putative transcriptional regulator
MAKKTYQSDILGSVHRAAKDARRAGVMSKMTMRKFDAACLEPVEPLTPDDISALRRREGVSQEVFARFLNVKKKLVSEWERGETVPSGPSMKLLTLVKRKGLDAVA